MDISIFGIGYVGLVSGACLAELGHNVVCTDVDPVRIKKLKAGVLPIWEPGLAELVERNVADGRLHFTSDAAQSVKHGKVLFIAVGTPSDEDGSADLQHVMAVVDSIARNIREYKVIVNKSTVTVGTAQKVQTCVEKVLAELGQKVSFDIVSNPEFLREGTAIDDFLKPDRIIVGTESEQAQSLMRELYKPLNLKPQCIIFMDIRSAELTKYAANAMLATKISFMNEMANLAEQLGADIEEVRKGIGSDQRIGYNFINPGCGYGGSCFPKDLKALVHTAHRIGYEAQLLQAVEKINNIQKTMLFSKLVAHFGGELHLRGKTIAVWGLAFKPNTDDMREAPSRILMEALWASGAIVQAYDPVAIEEAERIYDGQAGLALVGDKYAALKGADALVICTEWQQFCSPDFDKMAKWMRRKVIVDGRNLYQPHNLRAKGWLYFSVGRVAPSNVA